MKNQKQHVKILSGIESGKIGSPNQPNLDYDVLDLTQHDSQYKQDFDLAINIGIKTLRTPLPWHRVQPLNSTSYDWEWMDAYMQALKSAGIEPIIDLMHHAATPNWLHNGLGNSQFRQLFENFVLKVMERYDWVTQYTLINEPEVTHYFCTSATIWVPGFLDSHDVDRLEGNFALVIQILSRQLHDRGKQHVYVKACSKEHARNRKAQAHVDYLNENQYRLLDLLLGKVDCNHLYYEHYSRCLNADELASFRTQPAIIDMIALDYYEHNEKDYMMVNGQLTGSQAQHPVGFAHIGKDYADRYALPLMLGETNIYGYIEDRISWFKFMLKECEKLQEHMYTINLKFGGMCWYPLFDCVGWFNLLRPCDTPHKGDPKLKGLKINPQGLYYLNDDLSRCSSELTKIVKLVNEGKLTADDIVPHQFKAPWSQNLKGYINTHMADWNWKN